MKRRKGCLILLAGVAVLSGAIVNGRAEAKSNPYDGIPGRNAFGLKPPPPPPDLTETNKPPPTPLAQVELTGITSVLSNKRALLEIIPGPGKQMIKPILAEGERVESVEVVSINVDKNEVTIKNGTVMTNLTFKVAKSTPTAGSPTVPAPLVPAPIAQPAQTSFNYNQNPYNQTPVGSGRNAVMVGGSTAATTPNLTPGVNPPGVNTAVTPATGVTAGTADAFRSIPSRTVRAPGTVPSFPPLPSKALNPQPPQLPGQP